MGKEAFEHSHQNIKKICAAAYRHRQRQYGSAVALNCDLNTQHEPKRGIFTNQ